MKTKSKASKKKKISSAQLKKKRAYVRRAPVTKRASEEIEVPAVIENDDEPQSLEDVYERQEQEETSEADGDDYIPPDFSVPFDLSRVDWEERIMNRSSLMPEGLLHRLDLHRAELSLQCFHKLRLPDVAGKPAFADAAGEWFNEFVRAVFGSWNGVQRAINEFFMMVPKKSSKALALNTLIATPDGFTTMGRVRVGDYVIAADGRRAKVTHKSVVFVNHQCYEVEFSTGEKVVCDAEHLWMTDAHTDRDRNPRDNRSASRLSVKTTEEIFASVKAMGGAANNHRTELCKPLKLPQRKLPLPPYVLGYWLGNGHSSGVRVSMDVRDMPHIVEQLAANDYSTRSFHKDIRSKACVVSLSDVGAGGGSGNGSKASRFIVKARELGIINDKKIPQEYLRGSLQQRLELLRGLMDSDGHITSKGAAIFTTTRECLRDSVIELINSIGFKATCSEHRAKLYEKDCGLYWRVSFHPFDKYEVFTLPRKLKRQLACNARNRSRNRSRSGNRQIVAVRKVKSVPTQCISIDNPTKQYLVTGSLIPTHNTSNAAGIMVTAMIRCERPRAELLLVAPTHPIAKLAFSQAVGMLEEDPQLFQMCRIQDYINKITFLPTGTTLLVKSFDPSVLTGIKPSGVLIDELHVISDQPNADRVLGQIRGGIISQPEGFIITITTQSERVAKGVFAAELLKARKIRDGELKGIRMLPILYEFPSKLLRDEDGKPSKEWRDPKHWDMVTPNNGRSITVERLIEEFAKAEASGVEETKRWASQHLNIEVGLSLRSDHWVGGRKWLENGEPGLTLETLIDRCEVIAIGIDGGGLTDLLGFTVVGRETDTNNWLTWSHAWIHMMSEERKIAYNNSEGDKTIYADLERAGDLTIVERMGQDMEELGDMVEQVVKSDKLFKIGIDPSGIGMILDKLEEVGVKNGEGADEKQVVGISQGWRLNSSIKTTERRLAGNTLKHAGQPLMRFAVESAKVEPRGNAILITKQASGQAKIDPLMALFNAVELMSMNPPAAMAKYQMMVLGV